MKKKIKLYSILDQEQFNYFIKYNKYIADPNQAQFPEAYKWLSNYMEKKIMKPSSDIVYPAWAWFKYGKSIKPDLRHSGFGPRNSMGYLLTFEKEETEVLLSDFDYWHFVLNKWNLSEEGDNNKNLEESWENIFDLNFSLEEDGPLDKTNQFIQANIWEIKKEDVLEIRKFKMR